MYRINFSIMKPDFFAFTRSGAIYIKCHSSGCNEDIKLKFGFMLYLPSIKRLSYPDMI